MIYVARIFQALCYWPIYLFLRLAVGYRVEGQEHISGLGRLKNTPVIFASNHASYLDGPICAAAMPRQGFCPWDFYPVRFTVANRFFNLFSKYFLWAVYVRLNASVPVYRTRGDLDGALVDVIKTAQNDRGAKFWIYPEGRLTRDGNLQAGKRGVAYLAQKTDAIIVPVGISGNFGVMSMRYFFRRGTKVAVRFGEPFALSPDIAPEDGAALVMARIAELVHN